MSPALSFSRVLLKGRRYIAPERRQARCPACHADLPSHISGDLEVHLAISLKPPAASRFIRPSDYHYRYPLTRFTRPEAMTWQMADVAVTESCS